MIMMTEQEQRKLAANIVSKLDPALRDIILGNDTCYDEIINAVKPYRDKILAMWDDTWPQQWAYRWAYRVGDRDVMRDRVTESMWAYQWALGIGDRDVMRDRVTESAWAYRWAIDIGDKDIMRPIVFKDPYWKGHWIRHFGE